MVDKTFDLSHHPVVQLVLLRYVFAHLTGPEGPRVFSRLFQHHL